MISLGSVLMIAYLCIGVGHAVTFQVMTNLLIEVEEEAGLDVGPEGQMGATEYFVCIFIWPMFLYEMFIRKED